jgi:membrane carboxypeptidase/penicillin-binding protein
LTYLAALRKGLQPNTLVMDAPITLAPIGEDIYTRQRDFWSPKNYDGGASGAITLRRALEASRNLATAQLMANGVDDTPEQGLDRVCELALEARLYKDCTRYYPFVLGAQALRPIDLAAFYSAIASEGARPTPHVIESIVQDGREIYRHDSNSVTWIGSADRASFVQLKSILQGVLERGTARAIKHLAPYVAGKTGTTDNELDAWFVGFTNEVTVALWVGYDNADGTRRTLGRGQTGAKVALPMFEPILQAVWELHASKTALKEPSPEAMHHLVAVRIDPHTGDPANAASGGTVTEYFKRSGSGAIGDTQYRIVSRDQTDFYRGRSLDDRDPRYDRWSRDNGFFADRPFFVLPPWQFFRRESPYVRGYPDDEDRLPRPPRRVDPDYFWHPLR